MMNVTQLPMDEKATAEARREQAEVWADWGAGRQRPTLANTRQSESEGKRALVQELRRRAG